MPTTHPTHVALRDFLLGKLSDEESDSVEAHLSECPECLGRAAEEPVHDTLVELLTSAHTRLDQDRAAAATPHPDLFSTPSVGRSPRRTSARRRASDCRCLRRSWWPSEVPGPRPLGVGGWGPSGGPSTRSWGGTWR